MTPPAPQFVDLGRKIDVKIKKASAEEILLTLSDGTTLHVRPIVIGIERSLEKYNALGEPIYQINVGMVLQTKVPPKLKRKPK